MPNFHLIQYNYADNISLGANSVKEAHKIYLELKDIFDEIKRMDIKF